VLVNRLWYWHFGTGFVATPGTFGKMGMLPSHPELLDWLATEFIRQGWSIKQIQRLIMNSETYKMSSSFYMPTISRRIPTMFTCGDIGAAPGGRGHPRYYSIGQR
jgi:hypothetical protein